VYDGDCSQPGDWREVTGEVGGCIVLIGTVGLFAASDDDYTVALFNNMLNDAARAGGLADGLVKASCAGSPVQ